MAAALLHIGEEEANNTYTCWLCLSCGCKKKKRKSTEVVVRSWFCWKNHQRRARVLGERPQHGLQRARQAWWKARGHSHMAQTWNKDAKVLFQSLGKSEKNSSVSMKTQD